MPDLRSRLRSADLPSRDQVTARSAFRIGSMVLFFVVLATLVAVSLAADMVVIAILAGVLVSQMLYVILPMHEIRTRARTLWTGEAGESVYDELEEPGGRFR